MKVDIYGMPIEEPFKKWRVDAVDVIGHPVSFWVMAKTQIQASKLAEQIVGSVTICGIIAVGESGEV